MARDVCEFYHVSPLDVEEMTLDQIYMLACKREQLMRRRLATVPGGRFASPELGPYKSLVQKIRAEKARKVPATRGERKQRRRERRKAAMEFKRQQESK